MSKKTAKKTTTKTTKKTVKKKVSKKVSRKTTKKVAKRAPRKKSVANVATKVLQPSFNLGSFMAKIDLMMNRLDSIITVIGALDLSSAPKFKNTEAELHRDSVVGDTYKNVNSGKEYKKMADNGNDADWVEGKPDGVGGFDAVNDSLRESSDEQTSMFDTAGEDANAVFTKDDVNNHLKQVSAACGLPVVKELLAKYKAENISAISENDYINFIEDCNRAIAGA